MHTDQELDEIIKDSDGFFKTRASVRSWIRGNLRKMWSIYPVKNAYKKSKRQRKPIGRNGREIWASQCELCGEWKKESEVQVDHKIPFGAIEDSTGGYDGALTRLIISSKDMALLCKDCHSTKSYMEKHNCTMEQAIIRKKAARVTALPAMAVKGWLVDRGIDIKPLTNATKRKEAIIKYLEQEQRAKGEQDG